MIWPGGRDDWGFWRVKSWKVKMMFFMRAWPWKTKSALLAGWVMFYRAVGPVGAGLVGFRG